MRRMHLLSGSCPVFDLSFFVQSAPGLGDLLVVYLVVGISDVGR